MSVHITPDGKMVVTMKLLDSPGADLVALKRSIITILQAKNDSDDLAFEEYRVLELLKELEFTDEQARLALPGS